MKKCGIILGGEYCKIDISSEIDFVIACDKGYEYAETDGIIPDLFVGDFDSFKGEIPPNIEKLKLPTEKDDTDALYAVKYALKKGYKDFVFFCSFGKRLDHFLGNLQVCCFVAKNGGTAFLKNEDTYIYVFSCGFLNLPPKAGYSLSVLSLSDKSEGVSINGVKYNLKKYCMENTFPIGVSNEWTDVAEISVDKGILAVILSKIS